jgi:hypothetical protein
MKIIKSELKEQVFPEITSLEDLKNCLLNNLLMVIELENAGFITFYTYRYIGLEMVAEVGYNEDELDDLHMFDMTATEIISLDWIEEGNLFKDIENSKIEYVDDFWKSKGPKIKTIKWYKYSTEIVEQ